MDDTSLKTCPFCKEKIRKEAVKCRFCGEGLSKLTFMAMNRKPPSKQTKPSQPVKGRIGVFWWHSGRVLAVRAEVREGVDVDYRFFPETVWPTVQRKHPELESIGWSELPQGRVYFLRPERRFWVRLDRPLSQPQVQAAILKAFGLPKKATDFGFHDRDPGQRY